MNCWNDRFSIVATTTWLDPGSCRRGGCRCSRARGTLPAAEYPRSRIWRPQQRVRIHAGALGQRHGRSLTPGPTTALTPYVGICARSGEMSLGMRDFNQVGSPRLRHSWTPKRFARDVAAKIHLRIEGTANLVNGTIAAGARAPSMKAWPVPHAQVHQRQPSRVPRSW